MQINIFCVVKFLMFHLLRFSMLNKATNQQPKQTSQEEPFHFKVHPYPLFLFTCRFNEHNALFIAINKSWQTDWLCVSMFCRCVCSLSCSVICCYPGTLGVFDIVPCGALFRPCLAPVGAAQRLGQACDCSPLRCWEWGACLPSITPNPAPWNAGLYGSYPIWTPGNRGQGE